MKISLVVKPNSRQEGVEVLPDGSLRVKVNAPPIEGRANERVVELLAEHYGRPKSAITLVAGQRGKRKVFTVG